MSSNEVDLEWRKREIMGLAVDVDRIELELAWKGIGAVDEFDRMEAMDIINRIERKIMSRLV